MSGGEENTTNRHSPNPVLHWATEQTRRHSGYNEPTAQGSVENLRSVGSVALANGSAIANAWLP